MGIASLIICGKIFPLVRSLIWFTLNNLIPVGTDLIVFIPYFYKVFVQTIRYLPDFLRVCKITKIETIILKIVSRYLLRK